LLVVLNNGADNGLQTLHQRSIRSNCCNGTRKREREREREERERERESEKERVSEREKRC
jgi:hypothetical protein